MDLPNAVSRSNMVTLPTNQLRDRLNRIYDAVRGNSKTLQAWGRFDYLWDLKELAVLEGRNNVQIPDAWLEELERVFVEIGDVPGRGH
jgi:hypothetical protein